MSRFLACLALVFMVSLYVGPKSDSYIRDRVVRVQGVGGGECTGEQVRAPSGKDYILTAGHCDGIAVNNVVEVLLEDGSTMPRKVIAQDRMADLLLIEGLPSTQGLSIAEGSRPRDEIRTFTRGAGLPTYKTEGVLIDIRHMEVVIDPIKSERDLHKCMSMPKFKVMSIGFAQVCIMVSDVMMSTAMVVHGSSGGAVLNARGELVGVVSMLDAPFSYFVSLKDIKAFLKDR